MTCLFCMPVLLCGRGGVAGSSIHGSTEGEAGGVHPRRRDAPLAAAASYK